VLRRLAFEHRPPVAPPVLLSRTDVEVPRIAASAAVFPHGLLFGLWFERSAFVVDNDEMKPRCFEQKYEVGDARETGSALGPSDHLMRHAGAQRELALTQVGKSPSSAHISIDREVLHADQTERLVGCRALASELCGRKIERCG
jgi:hypothetical protein